jgi:hypothetical protein
MVRNTGLAFKSIRCHAEQRRSLLQVYELAKENVSFLAGSDLPPYLVIMLEAEDQ